MIQAMITLANLLESGFEAFLSGIAGANPNAVPRDMDVQTYLDGQKRARWYQKLLFRYERVSVAVKPLDGDPGPLVPTSDPHMALPAGSLVSLDSTSPGEFKDKVAKATNEALDYVFSPDALARDAKKPDHFLDGLERIHRELGSFMFGDRRVRTLQEFIRDIGVNEYVNTPPRNLIIISHAHWDGQLQFAPTRNRRADYFSYEDVAALAPPLKLDDRFLDPRKDPNIPPLLIFTGCNFGKAEPFLRRLRDAINPRFAAIAPKFFYGVANKPGQTKFIEYMSMPHYVISKKALSRDELIGQLKNPKRHDAHDALVDDASWERWVPKEPWKVDDWNVRNDIALLYEIINEQMPRVDVNMDEATFRADPRRHFTAAINALSDPNHSLSGTHPFPWWKRFGVANAKTMVETFDWEFIFIPEKQGTPNKVIGTAKGHHYSLTIPIVEAANPGELMRNEYDVKPGKKGLQRGRTDIPLPALPLRNPPDTKFWHVIPPSA